MMSEHKALFALKPEYFTAKKYVNLDFGGRGKGTCTTSAGGEMVGLKKPVEYEDCTLPAYRLFITGLKGLRRQEAVGYSPTLP